MEKSKKKKGAKPLPITCEDGMNKQKFLLLVQKAFDEASINIGVKDAVVVVDCFLEALTKALHFGKVKFYKFGSFEPIHRPERNRRNPRTNESVRVPEDVFIKFRNSPTLSGSLNQLSAKKKI